jgi:hypothetical protein
MRVRIGILVLVVLATTLGPAAAAHAGCGANVQWTDGVGYQVVGESKRLLAEIHDCGAGWVEDGPFYLYIAPGMESEAADLQGLRYLAPIEILRRPSRWVVEVAVDYVVPPLSSGTHSLYACDAGCHVHLGDLSPQPVEVVESRLELRMQAELDRSQGELWRTLDGRTARIDRELDRLDGAIVDRTVVDDLQVRLGDLELTVDRLQAEAAAGRDHAPWLTALGGALALIAGLLVLAAVRLRRAIRRRRELRALLTPDDVASEVVPFELEPVG